uniref:Uncharacterized protein n=1 Tax=Arundo donax TaxID=35708 RepID=A0A0A9EEV2_ARUDO
MSMSVNLCKCHLELFGDHTIILPPSQEHTYTMLI